jgi:hypothetical protein
VHLDDVFQKLGTREGFERGCLGARYVCIDGNGPASDSDPLSGTAPTGTADSDDPSGKVAGLPRTKGGGCCGGLGGSEDTGGEGRGGVRRFIPILRFEVRQGSGNEFGR